MMILKDLELRRFYKGRLRWLSGSVDCRLCVAFLESSAVRLSRLSYPSEEVGLLISYSQHDQKRSKRSHEAAFASL